MNESGLLSVLQRQNGKYLEYNIGNLVDGDLKPRDDDEKGYAIALSKDMDYVLVNMDLL